MRYHAMITDYDGTLTLEEHLAQETLLALKRLKTSGRKLILATGRRLEDIKAVVPAYRLFDCIVAENGAVVYHTDSMEVQLIGEQPPALFIKYLQQRGVPLSLGKVIIAGWEPHQDLILEAIKHFGLEHQVIFNKAAVMILPPGVNKGSGVQQALKNLDLSPHNALAVGDAENDCAMFKAVECAIAVQNAVPHVQELADWTTTLPAGQGVCELISRLIEDDLGSLDYLLSRHFLPLGEKSDGTCFGISPFCTNLLIAGSSGCGKTTLCAAFLERMTASQYQYCLIDPEGDYNDISGALNLGDNNQPPSIDQVLRLLSKPEVNVVLSLVAIPIEERPVYFTKVIKELINLRNRTGHPHLIVLDEAHHLVPRENLSAHYRIPEEFNNFLAITSSPDLLNRDVLNKINIAVAMGESAAEDLSFLTKELSEDTVIPRDLTLNNGQALVWQKGNVQVFEFKGYSPRKLLVRHKRKYATGNLGSNSFYFKGPACKLNLKANNVNMFVQMAEGVDEETWQYHRYRHDYSTWFRNSIKDADLATLSEEIESSEASASASRRAIVVLISDRYM